MGAIISRGGRAVLSMRNDVAAGRYGDAGPAAGRARRQAQSGQQERAAQPLRRAGGKHHGINARRRLPSLPVTPGQFRQPLRRSAGQPGLLVPADAGRRTAKARRTPGSDFDEDQRVAVPHGQVDLARPGPQVAGQQHQALGLQQAQRRSEERRGG
ncbi:hypothetical protein G6F62_014177 [Rhizopus arrhizus]|nr:hypothetical protein G6F62_014177 [Rhizopus arrhizus]